MSQVQVQLFQSFSMEVEDDAVQINIQKSLELLCYLLVYRSKSHRRESLATLLWEESTAAQSRRNLRRTLWQLQRALRHTSDDPDNGLLLVDSRRLQLNPDAQIVIDTESFESAYDQVEGLTGSELTPALAGRLEAGLRLYRGDLLENWYCDWCLYERQRLRFIYMAMIEKVIDYHVTRNNSEVAIKFALQALGQDPTRETMHRKLMGLYFRVGDRGRALNQYEQCVDVLRSELAVDPERQTTELRKRIMASSLADREPEGEIFPDHSVQTVAELSQRLEELYVEIFDIQARLEREMHLLRQIEAAHPESQT